MGAVGIGAIVGHLQDAGGIVAQAGHDFIGKLIAGAAVASAGGIAALHDEAGHDAVPFEAIEKGFAGLGAEGAFGEADVAGDGEGCFLVKQLADDDAVFGGDLGV